MILRGFLVSFFVSQSSWVLMYVLGSNPILQEPINILAVGAVFIPGFAYLLYKLLPPTFKDKNGSERKRNTFYYMCCIFAWSCTIDTIGAFEAMNLIDGYFDFYFEKAEPYLGSPFGAWIDLWDGVVHFALYLTIIYKYDNGKDYSKWGLYWFGSMMAGMFCLIIGALAGSYGDVLRPPILLNLPYIIMPFYAGKYLIDLHYNGKIEGKEDERKGSIGLVDVLLLFGVIYSVLVSFVRGLAAFGSPLPFVQQYITDYEPYIQEPGKFGAMHCIFNAVYCIPIQIILAYYVFRGVRNNKTAECLSLILSGALAQGEFFHITAATYHQTPKEYRMENNVWTVIAVTTIPIIVAHILAYNFTTKRSKLLKKIKK